MRALEFKKLEKPPIESSALLAAMWHEGQGDWEKAHEIAQGVDDNDGAWVHAYLHRKEGDLSNASYWYQRAGKKVSRRSLEDEWTEIVNDLLERS